MDKLTYEQRASLTRPDGMPIDYVPNHVRKNPWHKVERLQCFGTAPELWNIDPTPSIAIIRNGERKVMTHREFRTGQSRAKHETPVDYKAKYEQLVKLVGVDLSLAGE